MMIKTLADVDADVVRPHNYGEHSLPEREFQVSDSEEPSDGPQASKQFWLIDDDGVIHVNRLGEIPDPRKIPSENQGGGAHRRNQLCVSGPVSTPVSKAREGSGNHALDEEAPSKHADYHFRKRIPHVMYLYVQDTDTNRKHAEKDNGERRLLEVTVDLDVKTSASKKSDASCEHYRPPNLS